MAKVFIGVGHGGKDPGASANGLIERDINLVMAMACYNELTRHGVTVKMSRATNTETDTIHQEVKEENSFKPDIAFEIHNNTGGGDGSEFYYHSRDADGKRLAELCRKHTQAIGQNCRKVEKGDQFIWINSTKATAVLCEGFFLDNKTDKQIADTIPEQQKFGIAYAKAILEYFGIPYKEAGKPGSAGTLYKVQVGAFKERANAEKLLKNLKAKGFEGFISQSKG